MPRCYASFIDSNRIRLATAGRALGANPLTGIEEGTGRFDHAFIAAETLGDDDATVGDIPHPDGTTLNRVVRADDHHIAAGIIGEDGRFRQQWRGYRARADLGRGEAAGPQVTLVGNGDADLALAR